MATQPFDQVPSAGPARLVSPPDPEVTPRRGRVLIVEDWDDVRLGVAELLELNGYRVSDAANAEEAIATLVAQPAAFALVLLDLILPGSMSGIDLRARQLADPHLASIPTVVVSAAEPTPGLRSGLNPAAWLEKPFHGEDLLHLIRRFVVPEPHATFGN